LVTSMPAPSLTVRFPHLPPLPPPPPPPLGTATIQASRHSIPSPHLRAVLQHRLVTTTMGRLPIPVASLHELLPPYSKRRIPTALPICSRPVFAWMMALSDDFIWMWGYLLQLLAVHTFQLHT
uniref:Os01g0778700 protein n=1 Tax=Hydatigena taeniaeformis TaxID=6205 RepID=A0A0R3WY21_HYDTA